MRGGQDREAERTCAGGKIVRLRELARSPEGRIFLCILAAAPFLLTPWVHGDGIGYVAYLHSAIVDLDLDLANELEYLSTHVAVDAGGLPGLLLDRSNHTPGVDPHYHTPPPDPVTGRVPSNFSTGPSIAWAPAYLSVHAAVKAGRSIGLSHRDDGYGGAYYLAIALTSLACGIVGLLFAYKMAHTLTPSREAFWATLAIAAASPLLYYLYLAPSYGHAITALTAGAFFLYWRQSRRAPSAVTWFHWGLLAGLLFLVRWNDVVLAVPVFVVEAARLLRQGTKPNETAGQDAQSIRWTRVWQLTGHVGAVLAGRGGAALAGFMLVSLPQFCVWQYLHGRPWVRHSVETLQFSPEGLWGTLFSARHGLFIWTPITLLAVIGLFLLWRRDAELAGVSIAALGLLVLSNCIVHDWWAGASFGMRRMVSATPLFVLGLTVLFDDLRVASRRSHDLQAASRRSHDLQAASRRHSGRFLAPVIFLLFTVWNVLLLAQYSLGMISHTEPVSFATIASNQPRVVVRIVQLVGEIL